MKIIRVTGSDWRADEGILVVHGEDKEIGIAIPIAALPTLTAQARRVMSAAQAAQDRGSARGQWRQTHPLPAETFRVETMPTETGDRIILTIDPETDVETPFSVAPGAARELGQALIEEADRASSIPPAAN